MKKRRDNIREEKKWKVKKGQVVVRVGLEEQDGSFQRLVIPIAYLHHPLFKRLLEKAHEVYGYDTTGPLGLPCSLDDFLHLRWQIEKETNHHHYLSGALSFHHC